MGAGVRIQAGGQVHGQHGNAGGVDGVNDFLPVLAERTVQAHAKQAVHDEGGFFGQLQFERGQIGIRQQHLEQFGAATFELFGGRPGIVTIMTFAGQEQDGLAGAGEFAGAAGEAFAHLMNDSGLRLAGGPGGLFPFPHLT